MALDVYSPCPGGTGKKIKFCCSDLLPELQKIERMLEGEQFQACLSHVERLEQKTPDRACLMATHALLLRAANRWDDARKVAAQFLEKYPDNPVALAETAIGLAASEGGKAGLGPLQKALAAAIGQELPPRVYEALGTVGQILIYEGETLAARAVLSLLAMIQPDDPQPLEHLARLNVSPTIPLWVKDERRLVDCPADAPWRAEFEEAVTPVKTGQWSLAADKLLNLVQKAGDQPAIWRNVATLRAWTADDQAAIEALRKYVALGPEQDDAVEAQALAMYLSDDPLGDLQDVYDLEYPVSDAEQFQVAMAASPRVVQVPFDPRAMADENNPPPRAVFVISDKPMPGTVEGVALDAIPRSLCQAALYGKQTDREARLEVIGVVATDVDQVKAILAEAGGSHLGPIAKEEVAEKVSASHQLFNRQWRLPRDLSPEQYQQLARQYEQDSLLNQWPKLPLGLLDGKTPEEAAGQDAYRAGLLAAILFLEFWAEDANVRFDFNELRAKLGLPLPAPIDPEKMPIERVPLTRLARVMVEKLSDDQLLLGYRRALGMNVTEAQRKFSLVVIERPSLADRDEYLRAFMTLARLEGGSDKSLEYIDRGRQTVKAKGQSCAAWDIMELSYRFQRLEADEIGRLLQHIERDHMREPGVASAVQDLLMRYGLIRPDGTPAMPAAPPQAEPGIVVPGAAGAESGEIWTPGGQQAGGDKPKLWVPGME